MTASSRHSRARSNPGPTDPLAPLEHTLSACVHGAGRILSDYFGQVVNPRMKENIDSIVCDADLAADRFVLQQIQAVFPRHNLISEESGRVWHGSEYTWVIDPLDGTSNFVAGIPWFGVQIGVLRAGQPVLGAMFLPMANTLYLARAGRGAWRNGRPIRLSPEKRLAHALCAFAFDTSPAKRTRQAAEMFYRVLCGVRNVRATYCLVDFCYTLDGCLGGFVALKTKIWDIVPIALLVAEAGGRFTDLEGEEVRFDPQPCAEEPDFPVVGASRHLHPALLKLISGPTGA